MLVNGRGDRKGEDHRQKDGSEALKIVEEIRLLKKKVEEKGEAHKLSRLLTNAPNIRGADPESQKMLVIEPGLNRLSIR